MANRSYHPQGLILLDSTLVPVFCNSQARELLRALAETSLAVQQESTEQGLFQLPKIIHQFARDLRTRSQVHESKEESDPTPLTRIITGATQGLLLRGGVCSLGPLSRETYYLISVVAMNDQVLREAKHLTPREREVADLSLLGHTSKTMAQKLNISVYTVNEHLKSIRRKTSPRST